LLQAKELMKWSETRETDFNFFNDCLFGDPEVLDKTERKPWMNANKHDLVTLDPREEFDSFTYILVDIISRIVPLVFHRAKVKHIQV
jgi:hypothetical protein